MNRIFPLCLLFFIVPLACAGPKTAGEASSADSLVLRELSPAETVLVRRLEDTLLGHETDLDGFRQDISRLTSEIDQLEQTLAQMMGERANAELEVGALQILIGNTQASIRSVKYVDG